MTDPLTKPAADEVITEGQLRLEYFPRLDTELDLSNHVDKAILFGCAHLRKKLGGVFTDAIDDDAIILKQAAIYFCLGLLWQQITSMMIGFSGSELPREYISAEESAALRDSYFDQARALYDPFELSSDDEAGFALPVMITGGASADSRSVVANWEVGENFGGADFI